MSDLTALTSLATQWDAFYNGPRLHDPKLTYIVLSVERLLIVWAAWLMLKALGRFVNAAFPRPHSFPNALYWFRFWAYLRLREFPLLKIGAFLLSVLLMLQIPAGIAGSLNRASIYHLLIYPAIFALLLGLAQLFNILRRRIP